MIDFKEFLAEGTLGYKELSVEKSYRSAIIDAIINDKLQFPNGEIVKVKNKDDVIQKLVDNESASDVKNVFKNGFDTESHGRVLWTKIDKLPFSGKSSTLSGAEGELFWEYVSWLGASNKDSRALDDLLNGRKYPKGIDKSKLGSVVSSNRKSVISIYKNTQELINTVSSFTGSTNPKIYARWDGLTIDAYYDYMENKNPNYIIPKQKQNVADAVWVYGTDFIKKGIEGIICETIDDNTGLMSVRTKDNFDGNPIGYLLQVSLKKGVKDAQGGGVTDTFKASDYYDTGLKKRILGRAKSTDISIDNDLSFTTEGFMGFVKKGFAFLRTLFSKLFTSFDNFKQRITSLYTNRGFISKSTKLISQRIGLDYKSLTEARRGDVSFLSDVNWDNLSTDFNSLIKSLQDNDSTGKFKFIQDNIVYPDNNWIGRVTRKEKEDVVAVKTLILNMVGMSIISNVLDKTEDLDSQTLLEGLGNIIWDIKMGNTKLPLCQLYGDDVKWEVFDREDTVRKVEKITKWKNNLEESIDEWYPIIGVVQGNKKNQPWNTISLYTIKEVDIDTSSPVYFKIILRGDGFSPKMPTENKTYTFNNSDFEEYRKK